MHDEQFEAFTPALKEPLLEVYFLWHAFMYAMSRAVPSNDNKDWLNLMQDIIHEHVVKLPVPALIENGAVKQFDEGDIELTRRSVASAIDAAFAGIDTHA